MSVSVRRFGTMTLAGLVGLGALVAPDAPAHAQYRGPGGRMPMMITQQNFRNLAFANVSPNPMIAPGLSLGQFAYNTGVLGRTYAQIPPYVLGYNPYPPVNFGPSFPSVSPYGGGYGLGGGLGYGGYGGSPYGGGYLSAGGYGGGGYGLSTGGLGYGGGGYGGIGYGGMGYGMGYGTGLYGLAALTAADGQYMQSNMQARLLREQARQAHIDTRRRLIQEEAEYERMRPTSLTLLEKERTTELAIARNFASPAMIWSGKALNDLLKALRVPGRSLRTGPPVPLDDDVLQHISLTDGSVKGNPGLLKNGGDLNWPAPLRTSKFDEASTKFKGKFRSAVGQLKAMEPVEQGTLNDLRTHLKTLNETLAISSEDMSPSQYIEARSYLNQLNEALRTLEDPKAVNYFNNAWKARGRNVAELVENMTTNGLQFAASGPQEHAAYNALYQQLRSFEAGTAQVVSSASAPAALSFGSPTR